MRGSGVLRSETDLLFFAEGSLGEKMGCWSGFSLFFEERGVRG